MLKNTGPDRLVGKTLTLSLMGVVLGPTGQTTSHRGAVQWNPCTEVASLVRVFNDGEMYGYRGDPRNWIQEGDGQTAHNFCLFLLP